MKHFLLRTVQTLATIILCLGPFVALFLMPTDKATICLAALAVASICSFGIVPIVLAVVWIFALAVIWNDVL